MSPEGWTGVFARSQQRPLSDVPRLVVLLLFLSLGIQLVLHTHYEVKDAVARPLPSPPSTHYLSLFSLADDIVIAKMLMLWLQAFDNQPGVSLPLTQLDYDHVVAWLNTILSLDERGQYPILAAARIYAEVPDSAKKRQMLTFVYEKFLDDPDRRWPAMAHGVFLAKHRLNDLPLALKYAEALAANVTLQDVPFWVRQMHIYVLEDMGELEAARVLVGGLIDSGTIRDPNELRFLQARLAELEAAQAVDR